MISWDYGLNRFDWVYCLIVTVGSSVGEGQRVHQLSSDESCCYTRPTHQLYPCP